MLARFAKSDRRLFVKAYRNYNRFFRREIWNIGIVNERISVFLECDAKPAIRWLGPPREGKFLADPFAIVRNETVYILCEEVDSRVGKGRIACVQLSNGIIPSDPKVVIEQPVHMSYPYLVEHRGSVYCIPETYQAREISLYKAQEFPWKWTKCTSLVRNFAGVDATVFQFQDRWWLTCTNEDVGSTKKLFVWYAPDLLGPWKPHSANPVKTDVRSSRPAGTPFMYKGHLYRPAQDCSRVYGGRVVLNRLEELTPTEFKEEPEAVIEPRPDSSYPDGLHTVSAAGDITLLDGKRYVPRRSLSVVTE